MNLSLADKNLDQVYLKLGINNSSSRDKYNRLLDINIEPDNINTLKK